MIRCGSTAPFISCSALLLTRKCCQHGEGSFDEGWARESWTVEKSCCHLPFKVSLPAQEQDPAEFWKGLEAEERRKRRLACKRIASTRMQL